MVDELALVHVLFAAVALISCLSVADKRVIRRMPRALWVTVIVLIPLAGPIAWFLLGRPPATGAPRTGWRIGRFREPPRPQAPDDDPNFLRSLDQPGACSEEERRRQRKEDRQRRDGELRRFEPEADS